MSPSPGAADNEAEGQLKNILFCADGTWNGPEPESNESDIDSQVVVNKEFGGDITNVVKLFGSLAGQVTAETLALRNEAEKLMIGPGGEPLQISKYLHGVGDSQNLALKALGGALGAGVIGRIVRGYTFISRYYNPGDAIHILGFSRGAYTARALAGMIANVGLLDRRSYDPNDREGAYRRGVEAWLKSKEVVFAGRVGPLLTSLAGKAFGAVARLTLGATVFLPDVPIATVAVWDTVGSLGLPDYVAGQRRDWFTFVDLVLSHKVARGFHAMALDERRRDFPVTRWEPDPRIEEVWFPGAHSDIGGGNPANESGLSDVALEWMRTKLTERAVRFAAPLQEPEVSGPDALRIHEPWKHFPFNTAPTARVPRAGDQFHPSVRQRWQDDRGYSAAWPGLF